MSALRLFPHRVIPSREKGGEMPSRAQHRHRQSFASRTTASIAERKRRNRLGKALALPPDKASLRKLAAKLLAK